MTSEKLIQTSHYCQKVSIQKNNNSKEITEEILAEETPVAIVYNGVSHVVMMASPCDLEDFAKGFSITEGIINNLSDIYSIEVLKKDNGIEINVEISTEKFTHLKEIRRNLTGRTGCGLCGAESLDQVLKIPKIRKNKTKFSSICVLKALKKFSNQQKIQKKTGATHASGLFDSKGNLVILKEDVGRHNALDKLIGVLLSTNLSSRDGFALITSRASYEMVSKASAANIGMLVAVSGPTSLAINTAKESGMTLLGFARDGRQTIYANKQRIII